MYDFRTFTFGRGSHTTREDGMCVMEAVAYVAGEDHSDLPECASTVLSFFLQEWNDSIWPDPRRRELLAPFVFRLVGTRAGSDIEQERSRMAADWLVRVLAPSVLAMDSLLVSHADSLCAIPELSLDPLAQVRREFLTVIDRLRRWDTDHDFRIDEAAAFAAVCAADVEYEGICSMAHHVITGVAGVLPVDDLNRLICEMQDSAWHLVDRMIRLTETQEPDVSGLRGVQALKK